MFEFDIEQQLKYLLEGEKIFKILKNPLAIDVQKDEILDITNGTEYSCNNFSDDDKRERYDLILISNSDGLKLKKKSVVDFWPYMFTITGIDEQLRNSFIIIARMWCDDKKPEMNCFLHLSCKSFISLFEESFSWNDEINNQRTKVFASLFVLDASARDYVINRNNFKSKYGCETCEIRTTKSTPIEGQKRFRYYEFIDEIHYRSKKRIQKQIATSMKDKSGVRGVKGPSVIFLVALT